MIINIKIIVHHYFCFKELRFVLSSDCSNVPDSMYLAAETPRPPSLFFPPQHFFIPLSSGCFVLSPTTPSPLRTIDYGIISSTQWAKGHRSLLISKTPILQTRSPVSRPYLIAWTSSPLQLRLPSN